MVDSYQFGDYGKYGNSSNYIQTSCPMGAQPERKRMIVKSIVAKVQNKFHVSAAEIDEQDIHQIIVIGVAAIVPHNAMADSLMDEISNFVEENTEAEILDEMREIR